MACFGVRCIYRRVDVSYTACLVVLFIEVSSGLTVELLSSRATVGDEVQATCSVPLTDFFTWEFRSSQPGSEEEIMCHIAEVAAKWEHRVSVHPDPKDSSNHVLIIRNITVDDSGRFICCDGNGHIGTADLSVEFQEPMTAPAESSVPPPTVQQWLLICAVTIAAAAAAAVVVVVLSCFCPGRLQQVCERMLWVPAVAIEVTKVCSSNSKVSNESRLLPNHATANPC
jgi:hypothetical protein